MTTKFKVILLLSFLLTFAAGSSLGLMISFPESRPSRQSRLWRGLNLTDKQREQMREIWSGVMSRRRGGRRALVEERDEAIVALLTKKQLPQYEQIVREYERKLEDLSRQRQRRIQEAVERTKQILTPEQARKYEELRKLRRERARGRLRQPGSTQPSKRTAPQGEE